MAGNVFKAERFRRARAEKAYSQRDVAAKSGVAQATIGKIERGDGEPRPVTVRKLAEVYEKPPLYFLEDE